MAAADENVERAGYKVARFLGLREVLEPRDVFAILPMGYGKLLCYACLPMMYDELFMINEELSIVIVLTPLSRARKITLFFMNNCIPFAQVPYTLILLQGSGYARLTTCMLTLE